MYKNVYSHALADTGLAFLGLGLVVEDKSTELRVHVYIYKLIMLDIITVRFMLVIHLCMYLYMYTSSCVVLLTVHNMMCNASLHIMYICS